MGDVGVGRCARIVNLNENSLTETFHLKLRVLFGSVGK